MRCKCGTITGIALPLVTREMRHTETHCEPLKVDMNPEKDLLGRSVQTPLTTYSCCGVKWLDLPTYKRHIESAHIAGFLCGHCLKQDHPGKLCEGAEQAPPIGRKDDAEKPRWDLLPWIGTGHVVDVLTYGAKKYAPENWRKVEGWRWRYFTAAMRHLTKWRLGEKIDPESGCPHLAHAACCILFLLELDE